MNHKCKAKILLPFGYIQCFSNQSDNTDFCSNHNKNDNWKYYGRIDDKINGNVIRDFTMMSRL